MLALVLRRSLHLAARQPACALISLREFQGVREFRTCPPAWQQQSLDDDARRAVSAGGTGWTRLVRAGWMFVATKCCLLIFVCSLSTACSTGAGSAAG